MYCFAFQIPSVLANGSTRKIKWGGRKARDQVTFPRTFYSCWVSAGRISLQRSQLLLGSGSHLHTALAFSRSLISLSPFPASPRPENLSAPAHLGLVAAMVPTVAIKVLPDFFSFFELSPNFHISHFIEVCTLPDSCVLSVSCRSHKGYRVSTYQNIYRKAKCQIVVEVFSPPQPQSLRCFIIWPYTNC